MIRAMTNLEDIAVFVGIAAARSLSDAARNQDISLTVVSKRLTRLEQELGVRLVNRTTRQINLTSEGQAYLVRARDILARVEDAAAELQSHHTGAMGILRVTATIAFSQGQIAPRLARFMNANPDLKVHLLSTDTMLDIASNNVDVAIRQAILPDSSLVSRKIAPDRRVLVASPAYVSQHGSPELPSDIAGHRCIVLGDPPVTEWRFQRGREVMTADVQWTLLANDGAVAQAACVGGAGLALKSIWDAREDLEAGRLVELLPGWVAPSMPIQAVSLSKHHQPARIRAFIDFLEGELRHAAELHPVIENPGH